MIEIRRSGDRGRTRLSWLDSRHAFSFGGYRDPAHMGFGALRVVNDDVIAPGSGFGTHPHRDMEILTFVLSGALAHRDSLGCGSVIRPGDVQRMTAGTGILHSEVNPSDEEPTRLLQVWIEPARPGLEPSYEEKRFGDEWRIVASPDGRDGSLRIHQDAFVHRGRLEPGKRVDHALSGRRAWLQVATGEVEVMGHTLAEGDAAAIASEDAVVFEAVRESEALLFDLA